MNILILSGSPRKSGNTNLLSKKWLKPCTFSAATFSF